MEVDNICELTLYQVMMHYQGFHNICQFAVTSIATVFLYHKLLIGVLEFQLIFIHIYCMFRYNTIYIDDFPIIF